MRFLIATKVLIVVLLTTIVGVSCSENEKNNSKDAFFNDAPTRYCGRRLATVMKKVCGWKAELEEPSEPSGQKSFLTHH
jgi:hypothetical protein